MKMWEWIKSILFPKPPKPSKPSKPTKLSKQSNKEGREVPSFNFSLKKG